tara:strand:+ start:344 stop:472 length:129 start_codon:yes stop_codon:yes gene_type:complete
VSAYAVGRIQPERHLEFPYRFNILSNIAKYREAGMGQEASEA